MADLSSDIETAATQPASASSDGQSVSARSIGDMILADQYLASKTAAGKKHRGLRFTKLLSPNAVGTTSSVED